MTSIPDFTPQSSFERIDRNGSGEVNAEELIEFMKDNRVYNIDTHEAQHLINFFDSNGSGVLESNELSQIFLPCENNELRDDANQR